VSGNADVVRTAYEAFSGKRDRDQIARFVAPDAKFHPTVGGVEQGDPVDPAGFFALLDAEEDAVWEEVRIEPREFLESGDRVLVIQHEYRRGKHSGIEIHDDTAALITVRDGRITELQGYMDPEVALRAFEAGD
jgi:ketosteroid isomerase-like protein